MDPMTHAEYIRQTIVKDLLEINAIIQVNIKRM